MHANERQLEAPDSRSFAVSDRIGNSPALQRWDKRDLAIIEVPSGTAERFFRPALRDLARQGTAIIPALKRWAIVRGR